MDVFKLYTDDFEIIEILSKIPSIQLPPFNGITFVQFIDKCPFGSDVGFTFPYDNHFFILYKFGKEHNSGIFLIKCPFQNVKYLLKYLDSTPAEVFPNREIFKSIRNDLVVFSAGLIL